MAMHPILLRRPDRAANRDMTLDWGTLSVVEANREVYTLLKSGHRVTLQDAQGREETHRVRYPDWDHFNVPS